MLCILLREQFYTAEEVRQMEGCADDVHAKAREGRLPSTCFHETRGRGGALKRTKFFFGARCELQHRTPFPSIIPAVKWLLAHVKRMQVVLVSGAEGIWL